MNEPKTTKPLPDATKPLPDAHSIYMTLNAEVVDVDRNNKMITLRFDARPLPKNTMDMLTEIFPNTQVGLKHLLNTEIVIQSIR